MAKKTAKKKAVKTTNAKKAPKTDMLELVLDEAAIKKYEKKYKVWEAIARKVLTGKKGVKKEIVNQILVARGLLELAGSYEEAFIILDSVMITMATLEEE